MEETTDLEEGQEEINREKSRNKDLSEKVKAAATERDTEKARAEKAEAEKATALKDAEFYKNFSTASSKYQGASEYQDQIREKVMAGYDMEDAMVSTLAKEGKFTPQTAPPPPKQSPAGGSAITNLKTGGEKPIAEMSQDERRAALVESEKRGDISLN